MDFAMPFFVQQFSHLSEKVVELERKTQNREKKENEQAEKEAEKPIGFSPFGMNNGNMLMPSTTNMPNMGMGGLG